MRIVSLIPEATEILQGIGLGDEVLAVSPEEARDLDRLSGLLRAAQPVLLFTSKTEAGGGVPRAAVRRLAAGLRPRPSVYALEPRSLGEILTDVKTVGDAVGRPAAARTLIQALRARIDAVSRRSACALAAAAPRRIVCLSRVDPPVAAGWWLAELVGLAGGLDVLDGVGRPPRAVTWEQIEAARPDLVVCAGYEPTTGPGATDVGTMDRTPPGGPDDAVQCIACVAHPGPGAIDLLERLVALILPGGAGTTGGPI